VKSYHKSFETQYYIFRYNLGTFQIRYLDIPIHCRRLSNADWLKIEEGFEKRLSCWNGKNLPTGGRLALFLFLLVYVPMYIMSFFTIPKGVIKKLDYFRSQLFWQCDDHKRKHSLAKWDILCQSKEQGGLEIHNNLDIKNIGKTSLEQISRYKTLW